MRAGPGEQTMADISGHQHREFAARDALQARGPDLILFPVLGEADRHFGGVEIDFLVDPGHRVFGGDDQFRQKRLASVGNLKPADRRDEIGLEGFGVGDLFGGCVAHDVSPV